jgi:CubicO group peptidase (beta-lactamase class C family)
MLDSMNLQRLVAAALPAVLVLAAPGAARAEIRTAAVTPAIAARIDAMLEAAIVHQHLPGVAVAVERDGTVIFARGYGYRNLAQRAPDDEHTVFNIASASKQFCASSIMLLQEAGKLSVDDKLSRFFPSYAHGGEITLREMLNHTSGIPDYTDLPKLPHHASPQQYFALVSKLPLEFTPGSRYQYSNTNYVVLAMIVQQVSGEPYGRFVTERLYGPTGMTGASIHRLPSDVPDGATGYSWDGKKIVTVVRTPDDFGFGDGDVNASVVDLMTWDAALDGGKVVDADSWREMTTIPHAQGETATSGYGFGLELDELNGRHYVYHGGAQYGFKTVNGTLPDQHFAVVLVSNSDAFYQYWLIKQIIALFYPPTPAQAAAPVPGDDPAIRRAALTLFARMQSGTIAKSRRYSPDFNAGLKGARAETQRVGAIGPVRSAVFGGMFYRGGALIYPYLLTFPHAVVNYYYVLGKDGRVGGAVFQRAD